MKVAVFTDYDGTITQQDTVDLVLDTYGAPDWFEISRRLDAEGATNVERMTAEFEHLHATRDQARHLIHEKVTIDETIHDLIDYVRARGWKFVVVSQGMRESVETIFEKYGITGVEWHANALGGPDGDLHLDFIEKGVIQDGECNDLCGVCKSGYIRQAKREGYTTVYIGDGITDRCPAETADIVFAKRYLKKFMGEKGLPFTPFETFTEIRGHLEAMFPAEETALEA